MRCFLTPYNVPLIRRNFLEDIVKSEDIESSSSDEDVFQTLQSCSRSINENIHRTFWSCYDELAATKLPKIEETRSPIASELDRCNLNQNLLHKTNGHFAWWDKTSSLMSFLARIFLSFTGSSDVLMRGGLKTRTSSLS